MKFITDKQTLDDLNIAGKFRPDSIFRLFNNTTTKGGEQLLTRMFNEPMLNHKKINERAKDFELFSKQTLQFPFSKAEFESMENYLANNKNTNVFSSTVNVFWKNLLSVTVNDKEFDILYNGLSITINLLQRMTEFISNQLIKIIGNDFPKSIEPLKLLISNSNFKLINTLKIPNSKSIFTIAKYEYLFKSTLVKEMEALIEAVFFLDVYIAVATVAREKNFSYATAIAKDKNCFIATNLWHPSIEMAVGNNISITENNNLVFLTGANMAGKSTFMKAFGVAVYLAHMGFPVAVSHLVFSVKDGLYSSINVPDNLSLGYSHFYAEVLRVKHIATQISQPLQLMVIFDELFKGTNVKDAYDATLAITDAFTENKHCSFLLSTHITEVGEALKLKKNAVQFLFFPSILNNNIPQYTYKLEQGISNDKHGMMIIIKEKIIELMGN